ncbi:chitinase-3-like protein 1 [Stomoxys calcitrans]|uniref:chitinase n=1 Tax=Stomoxys calcitrans TaxID=35570 RepID=A0A1I8PK18_STOCA|nr:chitinase-3-like protein 1 [Stomoxys calcitrans]
MFLKVLLLTLFLVVWQKSAATAKERKNVVCYHGTWSTYRQSLGKFDVSSDIDPFLCTHLMYAFFGIEDNGDLRIIDPYLDLEDNFGRGNIRKFNALKLQNPTLKTLAAVGGWNEGSKKFSIVAADPAKRERFVKTVVQFLQKHSFDGLDLDWEYPNQRHNLQNDDRNNFLQLIKELKEGLEPFGYILTAAVGSVEFSANLSYDIPEMMKYLDFVNVMAYDLHGPWDSVVGINAPLYSGRLDTSKRAKMLNFDAIVKYWLNQGGRRDKLVMGVPFYGRSFTLEDPNNHGVGAPQIGRGMAGQYSVEPGVIGYNELCEKFQTEKNAWHLEWESDQKVPYAYNDRNWVGYENEKSIALKSEYVLKEDLAGIMVWSIESDDFRGTCSAMRYPLLTLINNILNGSTYRPSQAMVMPPANQQMDSNIGGVFAPQCQGKSGYVRDSQDCGRFYFCEKGVAHSFQCPTSLHFDLDSLNCNYATMVNC